MSVRLRAAEQADLRAVGTLHHRSRIAAYAQIIPAAALAARPAEGFVEWWRERWTWERETHWLTVAADNDGALAGFTYLGPSETAGASELYAIHVAPDRVGTGVGRALMADALRQLAGLGQARAVLWVLTDNHRARRFYEGGGWLPDGAARVEPVGDQPVAQLRYTHPLRRTGWRSPSSPNV